jgi:hypothetical protein
MRVLIEGPPPAPEAGAEDPHAILPDRESNRENSSVDSPEGEVAYLRCTVRSVFRQDETGIIERKPGGFERHPVLQEVCAGLGVVPFKVQVEHTGAAA